MRRDGLKQLVQRVLLPGSGTLAGWVDHTWALSWSEPVPAALSAVIGSPCVHLTIEDGPPGAFRHGHELPAALLHGVVTERFATDLPAPGWTVGLRLTPGAAFDLIGVPVSTWTGRVLSWSQAWPGWDLSEVRAAQDNHTRAKALEAAAIEMIGSRNPSPGGHRARSVVRLAVTDRTVHSVTDLAARLSVSRRTLERLCNDHIGVSPGWILRRERIIQVHQLFRETDLTVGEAADLLGWCDQAHLTNAYSRIAGVTPARLQQHLRADQAKLH
ncbi:helix-turn-helix transcriptional regulator [Mycobacterium stomatepiae]|nr:helix-turn-helix transcriptional regulator [Mycobacterium stomatepiae]